MKVGPGQTRDDGGIEVWVGRAGEPAWVRERRFVGGQVASFAILMAWMCIPMLRPPSFSLARWFVGLFAVMLWVHVFRFMIPRIPAAQERGTAWATEAGLELQRPGGVERIRWVDFVSICGATHKGELFDLATPTLHLRRGAIVRLARRGALEDLELELRGGAGDRFQAFGATIAEQLAFAVESRRQRVLRLETDARQMFRLGVPCWPDCSPKAWSKAHGEVLLSAAAERGLVISASTERNVLDVVDAIVWRGLAVESEPGAEGAQVVTLTPAGARALARLGLGATGF